MGKREEGGSSKDHSFIAVTKNFRFSTCPRTARESEVAASADEVFDAVAVRDTAVAAASPPPLLL
jgi:hypothetical protein